MDEKKDHNPGLEGGSYRELRLLEEIEATPDSSQRRLASQIGVALGVANLLVRSLAKKGYVRATKVGWRRWVYILTPAGFARKVHLTLDYVDRFMTHYQRVRQLLHEEIGGLALNAESRIAIYGTKELTELIYLALRDIGITEIDVFDGKDSGRKFIGMPVSGLGSMIPTDYSKVIVAFPTAMKERCREVEASGASSYQIVPLLQQHRLATRSEAAN